MTEKSSTELTEEIKARVRRNLEEIFTAVAGKNVTVMAATKTVPAEVINYATQECGLHNIGENRVQEFLSKFDALDKTGVNMHFIGTLQPNKVKYIIGKVCLIHSLDSMKLAEEISKRSASAGTITDVLCGEHRKRTGKKRRPGGNGGELYRKHLLPARHKPARHNGDRSPLRRSGGLPPLFRKDKSSLYPDVRPRAVRLRPDTQHGNVGQLPPCGRVRCKSYPPRHCGVRQKRLTDAICDIFSENILADFKKRLRSPEKYGIMFLYRRTGAFNT